MSLIFIDIDQIVLDGMDVRPDRAEWIKEMVEVELRRILQREGLLDDLARTGIPSLSLPTIHLSETANGGQLVGNITSNIVQALQSIG